LDWDKIDLEFPEKLEFIVLVGCLWTTPDVWELLTTEIVTVRVDATGSSLRKSS
jgi:hypothetical protein